MVKKIKRHETLYNSEKSKILEIEEVLEEKVEIPIETPVIPEVSLPKISLSLWIKISGIKPDQLAGFSNYCLRNSINNLTIPDWKSEYTKFLRKPIKE